MPKVELPPDFENSTLVSTTGPGVAAYVKQNDTSSRRRRQTSDTSQDRADIYFIVTLDALVETVSDTEIEFNLKPTLYCLSNIEFYQGHVMRLKVGQLE